MDKSSRRWLLLLVLLVISRLMFLTSMENPEPRYVVEFFVFILAVAGIAVAHASDRIRLRVTNRTLD
jgi:hypothetical protein